MSPIRKDIKVHYGEYEKDGEVKKIWKSIGEATIWDDGGISIDLFTMPGCKIKVFDKYKKD